MMSADVSARLVDARIITSIVSLARPNIVVLMPSGVDRSPTLMATTRSAPIARTTSAGTLFITPPSTSIFPSTSTGGKASGSDIVARMASASEPLFMTTGLRGEEVDGDGPERRRQVVEVLDAKVRSRDARQHQLHRLPVVQGARRHDAAVFSPNSSCDG